MKKLLLFFVIFGISSFCFVNAEENANDQDAEDPMMDVLDILLESNEIIAQKNESIMEENQEKVEAQEKGKKQPNNFLLAHLSLGLNLPFILDTNSFGNNLEDTFPWGISLQYTGNIAYLALKANVNWDYVRYFEEEEKNFLAFGTISCGYTPIHKDYLFLGLYGTVGFDRIGDYSYTHVGASGTLVYNFSEYFGIFVNLDATYRVNAVYSGEEETDPGSSHARYLGTWRISPSIGFSVLFLRG